MHQSVLDFVKRSLKEEDVKGKRVLEVGSLNVNGSARQYIESLGPKEYIGVDIQEGNGVDFVLNAEYLAEHFDETYFDIVVCTEMLEHVENWRKVIWNLKKVCHQDGILVLTTRSPGFPYHAYPHDYFRYTEGDMAMIFGDCEFDIEKDPQDPGVFVRATKLGYVMDLDSHRELPFLLPYDIRNEVINLIFKEINSEKTENKKES